MQAAQHRSGSLRAGRRIHPPCDGRRCCLNRRPCVRRQRRRDLGEGATRRRAENFPTHLGHARHKCEPRLCVSGRHLHAGSFSLLKASPSGLQVPGALVQPVRPQPRRDGEVYGRGAEPISLGKPDIRRTAAVAQELGPWLFVLRPRGHETRLLLFHTRPPCGALVTQGAVVSAWTHLGMIH